MKFVMFILVALLAGSCVANSGVAGTELRETADQAAGSTVYTASIRDLRGEVLNVMDQKTADAVCYIEPTPELKARLSPEAWAVLVEAATEPPFMNKYWNNHADGIYVDAADGTALFSSSTKFDSGTGWPSFWEPLDMNALVLVEDRAYGMVRIEVRARKSGGHLGHVFDDGPQPTGLRYCINSAALRFIPVDNLAAEGYEDLLELFAD
jgi:methionine-R-sulfoxide reductase